MPAPDCEEALRQYFTTERQGLGRNVDCAAQELKGLQANGILHEPHAKILEMVRAWG